MNIDAKFDKIQKILPIENADALEVALVSNFPCVVRKGEFAEGEWAFYIKDDAKLCSYGLPEADVPEAFRWQLPLLKYLGGGGRVKTVKLRGQVSMGILLKPEVVVYEGYNIDDYFCEDLNKKIADPETGSAFLEKHFGVKHWEAPLGNVGILNVAYQGLPCGLAKSDETNWEALEESDLHLGEQCLVTKKMDGSSCTVTCYPDGKYEISCRSMTFKPEDDESRMNSYQKLAREAVKAGIWWAKKHNEIIAFRGESCCSSFNKSSYNKDCEKNGFFIYGCNFPEQENWFLKHGTYGSGRHFLDIVDECNAIGFNLKHVDILEKDVIITKDLLKKYNDMPWTFGEGCVINVKVNDINATLTSFVYDYKSKSREYLMKMK